MSRTQRNGIVPPEGGARGGRRNLWVAATAVMTLMTASAALALAPPASGQEGDPAMLPPGDWTGDQQAFLYDMIETTEAELQSFSDPAALEARGFVNFGVEAPGGWDHWINYAWIDDGHVLNPAFPESLVFRNTPEGEYVLEAAMFYLPSGHDMSDIPEDLAWLPGWHVHPELCLTQDGRYAGLANPDGTCDSGTPSDMPPMMHVWIVDNACGHRFGGVGVGGLNCDVGGHDHGPGPTSPPTMPGDDGGHDHGDDPGHPTHRPHTPAPADPSGDHHGSRHPAPAATPVRTHPSYAG